MKADPEHQQRLLHLQQIDTRLQQIDHARARLPQLAQLQEATTARAAVADDLVRAETSLSDVRRELDRAESDVAQVRDRAARDQQRLDSGQGSAKDLTALQDELESLARRQSDLEDVEIEVMERAEAGEERVSTLTADRDQATTRVEELTRERDAALAELDRERAEVAAPRADLVSTIDPALITLYDRVRDASGGLGAAPLVQRRCGGCQLELNPVDLGAIAKAPADEVVRCEECNRILVRTDESGLPAA